MNLKKILYKKKHIELIKQFNYIHICYPLSTRLDPVGVSNLFNTETRLNNSLNTIYLQALSSVFKIDEKTKKTLSHLFTGPCYILYSDTILTTETSRQIEGFDLIHLATLDTKKKKLFKFDKAQAYADSIRYYEIDQSNISRITNFVLSNNLQFVTTPISTITRTIDSICIKRNEK